MNRTTQPPRPDAAEGIQGEGNYDAARRFRRAEEAFVKSGQVDKAARQAAPRTAKKARELADAEAKGRARAKD